MVKGEIKVIYAICFGKEKCGRKFVSKKKLRNGIALIYEIRRNGLVTQVKRTYSFRNNEIKLKGVAIIGGWQE